MLTIDLQTLYVAHTLVSAGVSAALSLYLAPRWHTPSARTLLMLVGVMAPWVSNMINLMEIEPMRHFDLTPAAFAISGMVFFGEPSAIRCWN